MPKALCLLHANCQGDALRPLLENTPAFAEKFIIRQYTNYLRQEIAEADIAHCDLFLYQKLAPRWGALSTQQLLPRLPQQCLSIEIPNFFFKGYWPFWTNKIKGIDFADSLLEALLERGLDVSETLRLYERGDPLLLGDVAAVAEESLLREEEKERDAPIRYVPLLREFWRSEQLFITVNHPGSRLLFHVADSLLALLGLGQLPQSVRNAYEHPQDDFWLPIHPALGASPPHLPFATAERRYRIYATRLTHREYTASYLACRQHGVTNLLAVLHDLPPNYPQV